MTLTPGSRLGAFEIEALIGAGGMGEVFRARDTKLNRVVALKILPETLASDPDRAARFKREAQTLAALSHPHIAAIHGLEDVDGCHFLVLELIDGEDLAQRIARGPIPIDEAVPIARQIADALEAAHEQGIVHRDLKPANIKVRDDGTVKVLDFGLAKALEPGAGVAGASCGVPAAPTMLPTITTPAMTQLGVILGTAAYMSPEQAKGRPVDKRSDIWAFGAVLYEMLTGKRAFAGDDISDTLASILKSDPDWTALPAVTPPQLVDLIRGCLTRDRSARISAMAVARYLLDQPAAPKTRVGRSEPTRRMGLWQIAVAVLSVATVALLALLYRARPASLEVFRFTINPPEKTTFVANRRVFSGGVISPDGRMITFTARDSADKVLLWVRDIDSVSPHVLAGTEEAAHPFWSPDSRFIAYTANGKLLKVPARGGTPQAICACASTSFGGAWNDTGIIVFNIGPGALQRVSSAGGTPTPVTRIVEGQSRHVAPWFLPDGDHLLYYAVAQSDNVRGVYVTSLETGDSKRVIDGAATSALYDPTSRLLLFGRDGILLARGRRRPRPRRDLDDGYARILQGHASESHR